MGSFCDASQEVISAIWMLRCDAGERRETTVSFEVAYHHHTFPKVTSCFCCMVTRVARATVCCSGNSFIQTAAADSAYTLLKAVPMCWMLIVSALAVTWQHKNATESYNNLVYLVNSLTLTSVSLSLLLLL